MTFSKEEIAKMARGTLLASLGIEITKRNEEQIEGTMPVDKRTVQPYGVLHGGATVALAETLGSFGSHLLIDTEKEQSYGVEVNCNHLKSVREGLVRGVATIVHKGRKTHIWNIEVFNETGDLVAISRITVIIVPKRA